MGILIASADLSRGFNETQFLSLLNERIQRKAPSDLDGAHLRLLFAMWKEVIAPAMSACDVAVRQATVVILHHWAEVVLQYLNKEKQ